MSATQVTSGVNAVALNDLITTGSYTSVGTANTYEITNIPSGITRFRLSCNNVSTNGTQTIFFQIGDSGGFETSGYEGARMNILVSAVGTSNNSTGIQLNNGSATGGMMHIRIEGSLMDSATNYWSITHMASRDDTGYGCVSITSKALSAELDRIRLINGGSDVFDNGSATLEYW